MAHTYICIFIHAVFSTYERQPYLTDEIRAELLPYLAASIQRIKGKPVAVNGPRDHVHLLFFLPAALSLSDAMQKLKANSSKWIYQRWPRKRAFAWQTGYAAFSVSRSNAPSVRNYIMRQEKHHRRMTYRQELLALLKRHGVEYDPRFVLD